MNDRMNIRRMQIPEEAQERPWDPKNLIPAQMLTWVEASTESMDQMRADSEKYGEAIRTAAYERIVLGQNPKRLKDSEQPRMKELAKQARRFQSDFATFIRVAAPLRLLFPKSYPIVTRTFHSDQIDETDTHDLLENLKGFGRTPAGIAGYLDMAAKTRLIAPTLQIPLSDTEWINIREYLRSQTGKRLALDAANFRVAFPERDIRAEIPISENVWKALRKDFTEEARDEAKRGAWNGQMINDFFRYAAAMRILAAEKVSCSWEEPLRLTMPEIKPPHKEPPPQPEPLAV